MAELRETAEAVVMEYLRERREHEETPELTPPPALDDIVFARSRETGLDERALWHEARALLLARTGGRIEGEQSDA